MFASTFFGCRGLTSLPSGLFSGITGAFANEMFSYTFADCSGLTSLPEEGLFGAISSGGDYSYAIFAHTFSGCTGLTSLPVGLFRNVAGPYVADMYKGTFYGCSGLESVPAGLFPNWGEPKSRMFESTFSGCTNLKTIPSGLFNINGQPADNMFNGTFQNCTSLTSIPANLFSHGGLYGQPASAMFAYTFAGCSGLEGNVPANLFGNIQGEPEGNMFLGTFQNCSGLTGSIMHDGQKIHQTFPTAGTSHVGSFYAGATGLDDWNYLPTVWGGGGGQFQLRVYGEPWQYCSWAELNDSNFKNLFQVYLYSSDGNRIRWLPNNEFTVSGTLVAGGGGNVTITYEDKTYTWWVEGRTPEINAIQIVSFNGTLNSNPNLNLMPSSWTVRGTCSCCGSTRILANTVYSVTYIPQGHTGGYQARLNVNQTIVSSIFYP